jgi:two-component system response regulator GlrR
MIFRRKATREKAASGTVPPAPEQRDAELGAASGKRILLVDDDPVVLGALSMKLKSQGYQVVTANDGSQAIGVTRKEKPDLMLLDVCFPPDVAHGGGVPWNGFLIQEWLQRLEGFKNVPVIFISAADRADYKQRATTSGARAFFQKPINNDLLLQAIDQAFTGQDEGKAAVALAAFAA